MARREKNHLQTDILSVRMRAMLLCAAGALVFVLCLGLLYLLWRLKIVEGAALHLLTGAVLALLVGSAVLIGVTRARSARRVGVLEAGLAGERAAQALFAQLPREYHTVSDLTIELDGRQSQLDHVIVGPTGVFVVETKNLRGIIRGAGGQQTWRHRKTGGGKPVEVKIYNPQKQVGTHVYRLSNYLRRNGMRVYVQGMVYFSHPGAQVQVRSPDPDIPIFVRSRGGDRAMLSAIRRARRMQLGRETREKIIRLLQESREGS